MALRGGPARRLVGNPLGGLLRHQERAGRRPTRRTGTPVPVEALEDVQEAAVAVPAAPGPAAPREASVAAVVASTDEDGRARWTFPAPYGRPPVLTAVPVATVPVGVVVEEVTGHQAVVRAWTPTGWAGEGVPVHLTARPAGS